MSSRFSGSSTRRAYFARHFGAAIRRMAALRHDPSDYVRHSAGNALRDVRRAHRVPVRHQNQG